MEDIMSEAFCILNVAENPACAVYWLEQLTGMLKAIGAEGRSKVFKQMFELMGVDMSDCENPNVGEYHFLALLAIKKRLSESSLPDK